MARQTSPVAARRATAVTVVFGAPAASSGARLERAAGRPRDGLARDDAVAVAVHDHVPGLAVAILVHLELDLDAAVLGAQLELGRAAQGAGAGDADVAGVPAAVAAPAAAAGRVVVAPRRVVGAVARDRERRHDQEAGRQRRPEHRPETLSACCPPVLGRPGGAVRPHGAGRPVEVAIRQVLETGEPLAARTETSGRPGGDLADPDAPVAGHRGQHGALAVGSLTPDPDAPLAPAGGARRPGHGRGGGRDRSSVWWPCQRPPVVTRPMTARSSRAVRAPGIGDPVRRASPMRATARPTTRPAAVTARPAPRSTT